MQVAVPLAKNVSETLSTMASVSAIDGAIQRKMRGKCVVRPGKGITLVISNKFMDKIIRIIKPLLLEYSGVLIDGVCETVKHEFKGGLRGISWHVIRDFRRFNNIKYINWERCHDDSKKYCKSKKRI